MRQNQERQIFKFKLSSGKELAIYCWGAYGGRVGFQHRCNVVLDGKWLNKFFKFQYYNRTWECFRYESLLHHTINKLSLTKEEKDDAKKQLEKLRENYHLTYYYNINVSTLEAFN